MLAAIQMLCVILQYVYDNILSSESVEKLNILFSRANIQLYFVNVLLNNKKIGGYIMCYFTNVTYGITVKNLI